MSAPDFAELPEFAELISASNYSFLRGASHPHDMVQRAHALGMKGLGLADRNSVAGVVRAHIAWREIGQVDGGGDDPGPAGPSAWAGAQSGHAMGGRSWRVSRGSGCGGWAGG